MQLVLLMQDFKGLFVSQARNLPPFEHFLNLSGVPRTSIPFNRMKRKCPACGLPNVPSAELCSRCKGRLPRGSFLRCLLLRGSVCTGVSLLLILSFYISLLASSTALTIEQKHTVRKAITVLKAKGFNDDAFLLESVTAFRGDDNWLNDSVAKENAYAATNFPFAIMTLYSDFFTYPTDDIERAAILLHEARHLRGEDEHAAYLYVWTNRNRLGWTHVAYSNSLVWTNIRHQTREHVPELFNCTTSDYGDCTE